MAAILKILGVIPARYKSTRFPGKPLAEIAGRPMVVRVAERAAVVLGRESTIIATDDDRIYKTAIHYGIQSIMTSPSAPTGTDRVAEVAQNVSADIYINIQGDEPLVDPADIQRVVTEKMQHSDFVINAMARLRPDEDPADLTIPKVVFNRNQELIYMSRLAIPGLKNPDEKVPEYWKQVCIYAFTATELKVFAGTGCKSRLEEHEDIEILRFFDLGIRVKMVETSGVTIAVDLPDHVAKVEQFMKEAGID
jgi:3-deoxy-manno-octulosonate cytidylyltransferase (CMP-KDO synthetase)